MRAPAGFSSGLELARARQALADAGLDPDTPLRRVSSVTNEAWLGPDVVVRVNRRPDHRLAREARLGTTLPAVVRYPEVIGFGTENGSDWIVSRRVPGIPLSRAWPWLRHDERRAAIRQLATMLRALHDTAPPADLPPVTGPHLLDIDALLAALTRLGLDAVGDLVAGTAEALDDERATTLIHGDLTFENVLWHDGELTALIDFEYSRPAPADLDLDVFLRFCAYPEMHVATDYREVARPEQYEPVPGWLAEDYPGLFAAVRLIDRLRLYAISFDVHQLSAARPGTETDANEATARLTQMVRRRSHIDLFTPAILDSAESR